MLAGRFLFDVCPISPYIYIICIALFQIDYFFRALFWHHYIGKCSTFNQGIIQQPIIFIIPMTDLSDQPLYI